MTGPGPGADAGSATGGAVHAAGATIGATSGYLGGALDEILGRLTDVLMAFPLFIVAMALVAVLGNSVANLVLRLLHFLNWRCFDNWLHRRLRQALRRRCAADCVCR